MKKLYRLNGDLIGEGDTIKEIAEANKADLIGADLTGADLGGASLRGANLRDADLRGTNLYWADLGEANLRRADLRGANLRNANLYLADLGEAKGIRIFTAGNENRLCFTYIYNNEQRYQLGCFNGTLMETLRAIKKKYGEDSSYARIVKAYEGTV